MMRYLVYWSTGLYEGCPRCTVVLLLSIGCNLYACIVTAIAMMSSVVSHFCLSVWLILFVLNERRPGYVDQSLCSPVCFELGVGRG